MKELVKPNIYCFDTAGQKATVYLRGTVAVFTRNCSEKLLKIHRKKPVIEYFISKVAASNSS